MKYTVTRDQAVEHNMKNHPIAIWDADAFDKVYMDSDGEWSSGAESGLVDELTLEEFEQQYAIVAPKAGSKNILQAVYSWE